MSGIENALNEEFPEATAAECKRFVAACQNGKKDADAVKEEAEKLLEDYLDWRSCYGLDYRKTSGGEEEDDAADWQYAIRKAIEVNQSMERAQELERKLSEDADKDPEEEKVVVNYDDMMPSDSQKSESENGEDKKAGEDGDAREVVVETQGEEKKNLDTTEEILKRMSQMVFFHKDSDGKHITDKKGTKMLHVLPAMIDRRAAHANIYGLALSFYLDRKFDRNTDQKISVFLDVRPGDGWPNPLAFMMVKFARTVTNILQGNYPERLESLILFPVPRAAMGIWGAIKRVFRYGIMDKIILVPGPAGRDSSLPKEYLEEHVEEEILDLTEQHRLDNFKPIGSFKKQE